MSTWDDGAVVFSPISACSSALSPDAGLTLAILSRPGGAKLEELLDIYPAADTILSHLISISAVEVGFEARPN